MLGSIHFSVARPRVGGIALLEVLRSGGAPRASLRCGKTNLYHAQLHVELRRCMIWCVQCFMFYIIALYTQYREGGVQS